MEHALDAGRRVQRVVRRRLRCSRRASRRDEILLPHTARCRWRAAVGQREEAEQQDGGVTGSARSCRGASMPLMPGSWTSIRMSAGCRSCAKRKPSSPSGSPTSFKFLGLSSTIRISSFAMTHRNSERERRAHSEPARHPDLPPWSSTNFRYKVSPSPVPSTFFAPRDHRRPVPANQSPELPRRCDPAGTSATAARNSPWRGNMGRIWALVQTCGNRNSEKG